MSAPLGVSPEEIMEGIVITLPEARVGLQHGFEVWAKAVRAEPLETSSNAPVGGVWRQCSATPPGGLLPTLKRKSVLALPSKLPKE